MTKPKPKVDKSIVITAILAITALEVGALFNGINGTYFAISLAAIAGLAGLALPTPNILKR